MVILGVKTDILSLDYSRFCFDAAAQKILSEESLPESSFELSLYLELLCKTTKEKEHLQNIIVNTAESLLHQEHQGQFTPQPILRVSSQKGASPYNAEGTVFADENGVFTAATALRGLCVCRSWMEEKRFSTDDASN